MTRLKYTDNILTILSIICLLCACSSNSTNTAVYQKITAETAYQMMQNETNFILLDVRTYEEFMARHINGAVLIPVNELGIRAEAELPDKNALIFVYCQAGRRSANAANILVNKGYTQVFDIGGITDWPY